MKVSKIDQKYLDFVKYHPGTTSSTIAEAWGLGKITPASRLSTMFAAGLLTRERVVLPRGMEYRYSVVEEKEREPDVPEKPGPEAPPESLVEKIKTEMAKLEPKPDVALSLLVNRFVSSLADEVVSRLKPLLIEKLTVSVGDMTEEITRAIPRKEKARLRRVLICGCLDKQGQLLKKEYEGMLDIDWVTVECAADVWKNKARNAFAVLVMADFVSHKHIDMLKETGAVPEIQKGGYTKLRDRLLELSVN